MTTTLLTGVNDVLKRVRIVQGATAALTSLTDSALQTDIDICLQLWREVVAQLQSDGIVGTEVVEGSITLVAAQREYSLGSGFVEMSGAPGYGAVLICAAKNRTLHQYPTRMGEDPYIQMIADQPDPAQFSGSPNYYAISPKAEKFRLDTNPATGDADDVYTYLYDQAPTLAAATDNFPFIDLIYQALVPTVAELFTNRSEGEVRETISASTGYLRALDLSNRIKPRRAYGRRAHQR